MDLATREQIREPVLCYVNLPWCYFTEGLLEREYWDDWNDAPYEHNAAEPISAIKVAIDADLEEPRDGHINSPWSVLDINAGKIAWLRSPRGEPKNVAIYAGTPLDEFIRIVNTFGGDVYVIY